MCGCHLSALVNYTKTTFNRPMKIEGECQADIGNNQTKSIPILEYSKCKSWSNSFVFPLISSSTFKFNENESLAENISRAMEHELSNLTGNFEVQYCGYYDREVFTITCTVPHTTTKDQIFKQISEIFKTSQILRDLLLQERNMELFDEMFCNENTTSINGTFHWPMTKIGTNVTIPCHANVATRYCSSGKMEYSEMPTSQYVKSPKCSPFTGVWKEPDMSECYNTEGITRQLENITSEDINEGSSSDNETDVGTAETRT
ncbi:Hypothetical predicted protein [Octopus vulgaris]|nr:Hypothetical predicted protein [Octopus vulgaris]